MGVVIFGDGFSFPAGDASTNRVHTYAKGFVENGINVQVICFANEYNSEGDDLINCICYYHPFGQRERSKYFVIRRWQKFIKYFKTIILLRRINKKEKIIAIMVYTMRLSTFLFAWYLSRINKTKLIKECSEHPLIQYQKNALKRIQGIIKFYIESRFSDGIFCISRFLVNYFKVHGVPERRLILILSTVDPSRFIQHVEKPFLFPYIGYFGGLTFERDNIDVLIKSFASVSNNHPSIHLVLGGFCTENEKNQIENLIHNLKITLKVVLLKYLTREEITRYIIHSDILVMVRGKSMETQASFPSKLTEYLATSKPVVTVNIGEIPDYLTDGVNSFIVEPGDCNGLTEKLDYVLNNYELALEIAERGKQLTATIFNYDYQAKRIIQFLETL